MRALRDRRNEVLRTGVHGRCAGGGARRDPVPSRGEARRTPSRMRRTSTATVTATVGWARSRPAGSTRSWTSARTTRATCGRRRPRSVTAAYVLISSMSAHRDDAPTGATEGDAVYEPPFPDTEEITWETYGPLKVAAERTATELVRGPRRRRAAALHRRSVRSDRPLHVVGAARRLRRTFPRAGARRPAAAVRRRTRSRRVRAAPVRAGNGGHLQRGHPAAAADARRRA